MSSNRPPINREVALRDRTLRYTLKRSARRRTIGLKITEDGLTVTLPDHVPVHEADAVVYEKADWVIDRMKRRADRVPEPLVGVDGESVGWLGEAHRLVVLPHNKVRTKVEHVDREVIVSVDMMLTEDQRARTVLAALRRWRKQAALDLMTPKLVDYAEQLGAKRPKVSVREQKSRWGSCSSDGSIRMNAKLIAYPEPLIDYVCAHEACHLLVMDHSARFHELLDDLMPDQKLRRRQLQEVAPAGGNY